MSRSVLSRLTIVALLALLLHSCALSSERLDRQTAVDKHCLWRVSSQSCDVYLLGSIHLLKPEHYPLAGVIEDAFAGADAVVFELDLDTTETPEAQQVMLSAGMYKDGRTLKSVLDDGTYTRLATKLTELGMDMNTAQLQMFKPWTVMLMIAVIEMQRLGFQPELGVDRHFYDRAKAAGKEIIGLETFEEQIRLFDVLTEGQQDALILQMLDDMEVFDEEFDRILAAWRTGDAGQIEATLLKSFEVYPDIFDSFISERNRKWLERIEAFLGQDKTYLVVVGAGHLVGDVGLVKLLDEKGFDLEQL